MGGLVVREVSQRSDLQLAALFGRPKSEGVCIDDHILVTAERALALCDVIIDFSAGEASADLARRAAARGGPSLVVGSTGFSPAEEAAILAASEKIAIVKSGNFSMGVALLNGLVEQVARRLGANDWDIEVFEAHHRRKKDAPSGTALGLAKAAARGRDVELAGLKAATRVGATAERRSGDIGFSVMRAGGLVGEHSVVFASDGEILTLSHSARDRRIFAVGAIEAAIWAADRRPGLYAMEDVLSIVS